MRATIVTPEDPLANLPPTVDNEARGRLLPYVLRPPLAQERLAVLTSLLEEGKDGEEAVSE